MHRAVLRLLLAQPLDHRVDVGLADLRGHPLDGERVDRLQGDLGENLEGRHVGEILALGDATVGSIRGLPAGAS